MKSFKNFIIPFLVLCCMFAVVAATDDDDDIGEIIGDIIAFIIGDMIGSCLSNAQCASVLLPIILYISIGAIILTIILHCYCDYKFDDDYYGSSRRYNRRTAMFGAGVGWGAIRNR